MIPLTIIVIACGFIYLRNVSDKVLTRIDMLSVILSTAGFGAMLYGFSRAASEGWSSHRGRIAHSVYLAAIGIKQAIARFASVQIWHVYLVIIGFAVIALLLSFFIRRTTQTTEENPRAVAAQPAAEH